jgi:hypothetical protein
MQHIEPFVLYGVELHIQGLQYQYIHGGRTPSGEDPGGSSDVPSPGGCRTFRPGTFRPVAWKFIYWPEWLRTFRPVKFQEIENSRGILGTAITDQNANTFKFMCDCLDMSLPKVNIRRILSSICNIVFAK